MALSNKMLNCINKYMQTLNNNGDIKQPVLDKMASVSQVYISQNFDAGGRWDGIGTSLLNGGSQRWKPLANSTKKNYAKFGYSLTPTLYRKGNLFRSIQIKGANNQLVFSANYKYAAAHQFGVNRIVSVKQHTRKVNSRNQYTKKKKTSQGIGFVKSHSRRMYLPARPFLTLTPEHIASLRKILASGYF